jgi:aarF domain-containing kinase
VFKSDLGMSPTEVFAEFSEEPLASASIAQVHRARLKPGPGEEDGIGSILLSVRLDPHERRLQLRFRSLMWLAEKLFDMPSK